MLLYSKLLHQSQKENKYHSQIFYSPILKGMTSHFTANCWNKNNSEGNYSLAICPRGPCQASNAQQKEKVSFPSVCQPISLLLMSLPKV